MSFFHTVSSLRLNSLCFVNAKWYTKLPITLANCVSFITYPQYVSLYLGGILLDSNLIRCMRIMPKNPDISAHPTPSTVQIRSSALTRMAVQLRSPAAARLAEQNSMAKRRSISCGAASWPAYVAEAVVESADHGRWLERGGGLAARKLRFVVC